jgi:ribose/xylose/arabinose/galactoside ABC-type transport system permease subunit
MSATDPLIASHKTMQLSHRLKTVIPLPIQGIFDELREDVPKFQATLVYTIGIVSLALFVYQCTSAGGLGSQLALLVKYGVPLLMISWGSGLLLAAGRVDISIGGAASLGGIIYALLYPINTILATCCVVIVGLIIGAINGFSVGYRYAPSLLLTWASGTLLSSLSAIIIFALNKGNEDRSTNSIALEVGSFVYGNTFFWLFIICALFSLVFMKAFRIGGFARIIGASSKAARYYGLNVEKIIFFLYIFSGISASAAGALTAIGQNSANATSSTEQPMIAIAIAVLGGTSMTGGYFSTLSVLVSTIFWTTIQTFLSGSSVPLPPFLESQDSRLGLMFFASLIVAVSLWFGRKMSGETLTVQVDDASFNPHR